MTFKAPFILTAFIQLHYHSLQVQHFQICILLKEVNCRGLKPMKNIRCVGKEDWRGENKRCPAIEMQVRCLTPHLNVMLSLLRTKNGMWKNWNLVLCTWRAVEPSKLILNTLLPIKVKQYRAIIVHELTINKVIFTQYLCNCSTSYQIKLFSFLQYVGAYSLIYVILINFSNNRACTVGE